MNLFRRHIGRRVAGVGVGVALLMLGLEAPAFAQLAISGFTPTSGPVNCVVVITGTDFQNPDVTDVDFGGVNATAFSVRSDTVIWAAAPATGGFITLTKGATGDTVSSSSQFTASATGCAPTVTAFTPTCGVVGTTVAITGTNLIRFVAPNFVGGLVEFSPFTGAGDGVDATHTGATESDTSLSVLVPTGTADGRIKVTTAGGTVFSADSFNVVTAAADCAEPTPFARSITLRLRGALVARGKVSTTDAAAPAECKAGVPVKIQRRRAGGWRTVGSATTSDTGAYSKRIRNRRGVYRSVATKVTLADGRVCSRAVSRRVRH